MKSFLIKTCLFFISLFLSSVSFGQFCYANLEGTYNTSTMSVDGGGLLASWMDCDSLIWNGSVRFEALGSNDDYNVFSYDTTLAIEYEDMSMGAYYGCYNAIEESMLPNGESVGSLLLHLNTCDELEITGESQWGEVYTINSQTVDSSAKILTIDWRNDYGEAGISVLTRTDTLYWLDVIDEDNDGFLSHVDCDDTNPDVHPNGVEVANNDVDEDCDGVDLMVGIDELSKVKLEIFPNPVKNMLYLKTKANLINAQISVIDIRGKALLQKTITSTEVDLSSLEKGIYFLEINNLERGNKWMKKIIID